ncbi:MAG TPA: EAL domain-containing protein [Polyangia bacterium]
MTAPIGAGLSILVVDDEPSILIFLGEALTDWGFAVTTAASVAEAQDRCARAAFDLLLLDKNLPDGNGLTVARQVTGGEDDCAVMIMSGYANLTSAVEAIQCQVADYLIKPFNLDDLRARLQRVVEHQALRRHNRQLALELSRKNAILESLAARDVLTTLFNHAYFQDAVERELARSARHHLCFAVVLLDIDGFHRVNEAAGHRRGDEVLGAIGRLIDGRARATQAIAARFDQDAFALLLPQTATASAAAAAEELRQLLARHDFGLRGAAPLAFSAGVASYPRDGATREQLLTAAQLSHAAAKAAGGNRVVSYGPHVTAPGSAQPEVVRRELERHAALDRTIAHRAFHVLYQPITDVRTGTAAAYEALCRPAEATFHSPLELFAAAERAGRVATLGRIVRELSVAPLAQLPEPALLFLNIHPHELFHSEALEREPALRPWAARIVFEITEGAELDDVDRAHERIQQLRTLGFRVAVDDLGAGYSSLNRLASLAPDYVKLDMALIRGIHADSRAARLIQHVVEYCRAEPAALIAEGVETADELRTVTALGVPLVQGFYLGRPAPGFGAARKAPADATPAAAARPEGD